MTDVQGDGDSLIQGNLGLLFLPGTSERHGDRILSHGHGTMLDKGPNELSVDADYFMCTR